MPAYKHPCPHCGNFIARDVHTCPYCATVDPFAPRRCTNCRAIIEDAAMIACPQCGGNLAEQAAKAAAEKAAAEKAAAEGKRPAR